MTRRQLGLKANELIENKLGCFAMMNLRLQVMADRALAYSDLPGLMLCNELIDLLDRLKDYEIADRELRKSERQMMADFFATEIENHDTS